MLQHTRAQSLAQCNRIVNGTVNLISQQGASIKRRDDGGHMHLCSFRFGMYPDGYLAAAFY